VPSPIIGLPIFHDKDSLLLAQTRQPIRSIAMSRTLEQKVRGPEQYLFHVACLI
jgi:hypothetical protein